MYARVRRPGVTPKLMATWTGPWRVVVVRVAEADDRSLIVLVDWVGFEVDERTWEPFKEIFEAAPEFLAKELRKLRVTRAIVAARVKREFGNQLRYSQLPGVLFVSSLLIEFIRLPRIGGAVTKYSCLLSL